MPLSKPIASPVFAQTICMTGLLLVLQAALLTGQEGSQPRLPREQLLLYHQPDGALAEAKSMAQWQARRQAIACGFASIAGNLPGPEKRCPLEVQLEEEVDCGSYLRRRISYQSEPGCRVPAYLCIPKRLLGNSAGDQSAPAVLCLHSTDDRIGYGLVVGLSSQTSLAYASELAERGLVTIAPSYPLLANYQPDLTALGWQSGTLKAVWDNQRAIDLLESLPFVRRRPVGAIGHSLGGHNAVFTAFLDQRIGVVVSSCGLDSFLDYYAGNEQVWQPEKGWTQTRYMPRLGDYRGRLEAIPFDFHELVAGLAPRPVLLIAPQRDENFRAASVDRIAAAARPVFELQGNADHLRVLHPDCGHDFPKEMRAAAYEWLEQALRER